MNKIKIRLSVLGHIPYALDLKSIPKWKSSLFEVYDSINSYSILSNADGENWEFSDKNLQSQLPKRQDEDILIAITNVPIEDNFFVRRLTDNRICISYHDMAEILKLDNIPLENLLLRVLYSVSFVFKKYGNRIPGMSEMTNFTHDETRACIFDMNGIKTDIIYSLNRPQLCKTCIVTLSNNANHRIEMNLIDSVQKELKKIKKYRYYRIIDFIKKHPYWAFIISTVTALAIGTIGSVIASFVYDSLKTK